MEEKKKIGKLLELLNEYDSGWDYDDYWGIYQYGMDRDAYIYHKYYALSKSYGFIKWLVENDKININEEWNDYEKTNLYCNSDFFQLQKHYSYYESLLMLLAISDTPIDDLINYLK